MTARRAGEVIAVEVGGARGEVTEVEVGGARWGAATLAGKGARPGEGLGGGMLAMRAVPDEGLGSNAGNARGARRWVQKECWQCARRPTRGPEGMLARRAAPDEGSGRNAGKARGADRGPHGPCRQAADAPHPVPSALPAWLRRHPPRRSRITAFGRAPGHPLETARSIRRRGLAPPPRGAGPR